MDSEIICGHALKLIVDRGSSQAKDNQTVRRHLFNFVGAQSDNISKHLIAQAGEAEIDLAIKEKEDKPPAKIERDSRGYRSMNVSLGKDKGTES